MTIFFGLELDDLVFPTAWQTQANIHYCGPKGFLLLLESHLGLSGYPGNTEYLRIEQYRQLLLKYLGQQQKAFFQASFQADQLATATTLLAWRDELLLAGWDFDVQDDMPDRLRVLATVEQYLRTNNSMHQLSSGFADRFIEMEKMLSRRKQPIENIFLNEPIQLLPGHFRKILNSLQSLGAEIIENASAKVETKTDLDRFKYFLTHPGHSEQKWELRKDGTLMILKSKRETTAASYLAKLFRKNSLFRPLCLIPEKNRTLDNALIQEGLPSLGIRSASLARPSLQILKLVPAFLWRPIDPYKILEFVSLSLKPLADDLGKLIAQQMAQTPGLKGEGWYIMINRYFDQLKIKAATDPSINFQEIKNQFDFWFDRRPYDVHGKVPKEEVADIFRYLAKWAIKTFDEGNSKNNSMLVLHQQSQNITELLEALPESENQLGNLQLERIVRTIYEPSPYVFQEKQKGHLPYIHKLSAMTSPASKLVWWNFIHNETDHFFSSWYEEELDYLQSCAVGLTGPKEKNHLQLWQRKQPILRTQNQLILVIPEMVEGSKVQTHPLWGDLEACFENLKSISYNLDLESEKKALATKFELPQYTLLSQRQLGNPKALIQIESKDQLGKNEEESFSSLDSLFYYPYKWVFKHKIKLKKSSILSIVDDKTLMGNLAHRFFELMLRQDITSWQKSDVEEWIDQQSYRLLSREGAVLLMYGREPERLAFINKLKYAAWSLIYLIQKNGWTVLETEKVLAGKFLGMPVKAKADLVLSRGSEMAVVDLKWRGASRRQRIIKNEEDLQLVMYAKLLTEDHGWAHTAFFIMEEGKMITRNNQAFKEALAVDPDCDHIIVNERIWAKMEATFQWRIEQLAKGLIEVRTKSTVEELEEIYGGQLMEVLEMKSEDASFDDYRTLINLLD